MKLALILIVACVLAVAGCVRAPDTVSENKNGFSSSDRTAAPAADAPVPEVTPENTTFADKDPQYLCVRLAELKRMPREFYGHSGDAVYDGLMRKGYHAMPCLVERITDTRPAENPTGAPFWAGLTYRVGDTAVLMLMGINETFWPKGMLPKKYEQMFDSEGMFAYYFCVDERPTCRREVQRWWRGHLKTCKPKCQTVETLGRKKTE